MKRRNVNVRTQEQWNIVSEELGYEWGNENSWEVYNNSTTILLFKKGYANVDWCLEEGEEVITFEQWQKEIEANKTKTKSFEELQKLVIEWGKDKGILVKENHLKQFAKTVSELGELGDAIIKEEKDNTIDAIGDVFVCMIILSEQLGLNPIECLETAYNVIAKRTGKTKNGVFIKD